jgi:hypothetical protein
MFHVLSTIAIERVIDLAMAAALTILVLPRVVAMDWVEPVAYTTLTVVVIGLLSLAVMARLRQQFHALMVRIAGRVSLVKKYLLPVFDSLLDGLSALTSTRHPVTFGWMGLAWASESPITGAAARLRTGAILVGIVRHWIVFGVAFRLHQPRGVL